MFLVIGNNLQYDNLVANTGLNIYSFGTFPGVKFISVFAQRRSCTGGTFGCFWEKRPRDLQRQADLCEPYGSGSHALRLLPGGAGSSSSAELRYEELRPLQTTRLRFLPSNSSFSAFCICSSLRSVSAKHGRVCVIL